MSIEDCKNRVIIIAEDIDLRVIQAIKYAKMVSDDITVFGCTASEEGEQNLRARWDKINTGIPFVLCCSQDGGIADLLLEFIRSTEYGCAPVKTVTVILPRLLATGWWGRLLDNHVSKYIERRLLEHKQIIVEVLPVRLEDDRSVLASTTGGIRP
jgi:hypothetical protein